MTDIISLINDKIKQHKGSRISFNDLFDGKVSYKTYCQYKQLYSTLVKEYYENIQLQDEDEDEDSIKLTIDFNELKLLFCNKYSSSFDWNQITKDYKINFVDYVKCDNLLKEYYENVPAPLQEEESIKLTIEFNELKLLFCSKYYTNTLDWSQINKDYKINFADYVKCYELLKSSEYLEFKNYLTHFNITDIDEIITELKTL